MAWLARAARRGALLFALLLGATPPGPAAGYDLTGRWQLFVDDEGVANRSSSVTRRYHQFVKHPGAMATAPPPPLPLPLPLRPPVADHGVASERRTGNPLLGGGRQYDGGARLYGTVLPSPGGGTGLSMWHQCITMAVCYANSSDGLNWTRPHLDLVEDQIAGGCAAEGALQPCLSICLDIAPCRWYTGSRSTLFTRLYSSTTPDRLCTFNKDGLMKTAAKGRPHRTCKDTQPSVVLGKTGVYELFNFNYGQDMDSKCPPGTGACDKSQGYYRSWSSDGIHWIDDTVRIWHWPPVALQLTTYTIIRHTTPCWPPTRHIARATCQASSTTTTTTATLPPSRCFTPLTPPPTTRCPADPSGSRPQRSRRGGHSRHWR